MDTTMTIFISHSSRDQKVARTLCDALEARGLHCWIANRNVDPGENFQESIVKAIRSARVMVLVFTKNANNSDEIKKEIALASQHELVVIPVRIDDVIPNDALAYELATRQWIDLFQDWERAIERLTARIGAVVASGSLAPASTDCGVSADTSLTPIVGKNLPAPEKSVIPASYATLSLNAHLLAAFLLNMTTFLLAQMMFSVLSDNFAGAFVATVLALPVGVVSRGLIDKDQNVRAFGLAISIVGLIAVGAVVASPYLLRIDLLEDHSVQNGSLLTGIYFLAAASFFGVEWKKFSNPSVAPANATQGVMKVMFTRWGSRLIFASSLIFVSVTWTVTYKLTGSVLALLALMSCHAAIVAYCYVRFRKDITPAAPAAAAMALAR
jgi:hypothetical protein